MYSEHRLDTPPPKSQFRRPWSPDPYDPFPSNSVTNNPHDADGELAQNEYTQYQYHQQQRREPSDVSVEALDLADYARTLPQRTADPYFAYNPHDNYTQTPLPLRPLNSRDSLHPPSLISGGGTSSQSHPSSRTSRTSRRPFSLPPPARHLDRSPFGRTHDYPASKPQFAEPEVDISQFPSWSRGWYESKGMNYPSNEPLTQSPFDPAYNPKYPYASDMHRHADPYALSSNTSTRDMLPWSTEPTDFGPPIDPETKEERLRMLRREFDPRSKGNNGAPGSEYSDGRPMIGSVDAKGKLITQGPKKRIATRLLQGVLSLTAAIPSIYAAIVSTSGPSSLLLSCLTFIYTHRLSNRRVPRHLRQPLLPSCSTPSRS